MAAPRPPTKPSDANEPSPDPPVFCAHCGRPYEETDGFCSNCGTPHPQTGSETPAEPTPEHTKPRKRHLRRAALILLALLIGLAVTLRLVFTFVTIDPLSASQQELVDVFGYPPQFSIAYVPAGTEDDEFLVRSEVWYYPDHGQQVTFLAGAIVSVTEMPEDELAVTYPDLRPEQFDVDMAFDEIAALAGPEVALVEVIAGDEGDLELYAGEGVLFAMERNQLVFLQTIGLAGGG